MIFTELVGAHKDEVIEKILDDIRPIALQYWVDYCLKVDTAIATHKSEHPGVTIPKQRNTDPKFREQVTQHLNGQVTQLADAQKAAETQLARAFLYWLSS